MTHFSPDRVSSDLKPLPNLLPPIEVEARILDYVRSLLSKNPGRDRFELAPLAHALGTTSRTIENLIRAASAAFEEDSPYGYVRSSRSDDLDDCWLARRSRRIYRTPPYPKTAYKGFRAIFPQEYACLLEHWLFVAYTRSQFAERGVPLEVLRRAAIGPSPSEKSRERFKGWLMDAQASGRVIVGEGDLVKLGDPRVAIIEGWIEELSTSNAIIEKNTTEGFDGPTDHWHSEGYQPPTRLSPADHFTGAPFENDDESLDTNRNDTDVDGSKTERTNSLSTTVEEMKKTAPSVREDADSSFLPSEKQGDPFVTNPRAPGDPLSANAEEPGDPSPAFSGRSLGDLLSVIPGGIIEEPYRTAPFDVSAKPKVKPLSKAEVKLRNRLDLVLKGTTEGRAILNQFLDEFPKALAQHGKPWSLRRVLSFLLTGRSDSTIPIGGELREEGVRFLNVLKDKGLLSFRKLVQSDGCYRKNDGNRYYLPMKG
jgi:hypothetical protein